MASTNPMTTYNSSSLIRSPFKCRRRKNASGWKEQDHPRADDGKFTSGGGGGSAPETVPVAVKPTKVEAAKYHAHRVASKISHVFQRVVNGMSERKKGESADVQATRSRRESYTHHITSARNSLADIGVDDTDGGLWGHNLFSSPILRAEALRNPLHFDRKLNAVEDGLVQASLFADSHGPTPVGEPSTHDLIRNKLSQVRRLRDAVEMFRHRNDVEVLDDPPIKVPLSPKPGVGHAAIADVALSGGGSSGPAPQPDDGLVMPAHRGKRGAAAKNTKAALDHLAKGHDANATVEHVMGFGGLKRSTAQKYVRAAIKQAKEQSVIVKDEAKKRVQRLRREIKRAG